jgi:hypothetical protein
VVPILSCEGPWKLFLPVSLFIHNIHGPTIAIRPMIHRVGYGDVILLFVTLFEYEYDHRFEIFRNDAHGQ